MIEQIQQKKDAAYWVEWNLENWARWMGTGGVPEGLPEKASGGIENYSTIDRDSDGYYEKLDNDLAQRTAVVVDELPPVHKSVIYREYGIVAVIQVWRYQDILREAKLLVQDGLRRRNVWLGE